MRRNPNVNHLVVLALALPLGALLAGCAGRRPVAELARADQAIRHAQTTSEAATYAPSELASAHAKLATARRAMADGDYSDARDLADQARAYAELAEEKAESQRSVSEARRTISDVEVLESEGAASPDSVVVERRTVTRSMPTSVVVERPVTSSVVVEPATPPPASVVVERPQPPSGVVVQHDPQVIVVPE